MVIVLFSILIGLSCSNDTDLLANAVLSDETSDDNFVVDDYFVVQFNESSILNVLSNDGFSLSDNVQIIEISNPIYGNVVINEDRGSITYTPEVLEEETQAEEEIQAEEETQTEEETKAEEETQTEVEVQTGEGTQTGEEHSGVTDTFTYTTEVVNEDQTTSIEEGTVEVVITPEEESTTEEEEEETPEEESTTEEEEEETPSTEEEEEEENMPPNAVVSADPIGGTAPLKVQFNGDNSSDDAKIESFIWDFKDGSTTTDVNPSHTFEQAGEYEVQLLLEDAEGLKHSKTVVINVLEPQNQAPIAAVTATPVSGIAPLAVQFDGSNSTDDNSVFKLFLGFSRWRICYEPESITHV